MAVHSATMRQVAQIGGKLYLRFTDGEEREFSSLAELKDWIRSVLTDDTPKALMMAMLIERQPNLANPAVLEGKTLSINLANNNWGTVA